MGIVYYLARVDNRTLFEIGKFSAIADLFRELGEGRARDLEFMPRNIPSESNLRELVVTAIKDLNLSIDRDTYANELARRVVRFTDGNPVCLLNDASSDEILWGQYTDDNDELRVIDSVYTSNWKLGSLIGDRS